MRDGLSLRNILGEGIDDLMEVRNVERDIEEHSIYLVFRIQLDLLFLAGL